MDEDQIEKRKHEIAKRLAKLWMGQNITSDKGVIEFLKSVCKLRKRDLDDFLENLHFEGRSLSAMESRLDDMENPRVVNGHTDLQG